MEQTSFECVLCGETFFGYGNNPWPLSEHPEDRCCDDCNREFVIPARLRKLIDDKEEEEIENEIISQIE